jgi:hypothetical protein
MFRARGLYTVKCTQGPCGKLCRAGGAQVPPPFQTRSPCSSRTPLHVRRVTAEAEPRRGCGSFRLGRWNRTRARAAPTPCGGRDRRGRDYRSWPATASRRVTMSATRGRCFRTGSPSRCNRSGLVARSTAGPDRSGRHPSRVVHDRPIASGELSTTGSRSVSGRNRPPSRHRGPAPGDQGRGRTPRHGTPRELHGSASPTSPATMQSRGRRGRSQARLVPGEPARCLQRRPGILDGSNGRRCRSSW